MYGDTQNTGATRSQCSLDISTFRVSYKAMTVGVFVSLCYQSSFSLVFYCLIILQPALRALVSVKPVRPVVWRPFPSCFRVGEQR